MLGVYGSGGGPAPPAEGGASWPSVIYRRVGLSNSSINKMIALPDEVTVGDLLIVVFLGFLDEAPEDWVFPNPQDGNASSRFRYFCKRANGTEGGTSQLFVDNASGAKFYWVYQIDRNTWRGGEDGGAVDDDTVLANSTDLQTVTDGPTVPPIDVSAWTGDSGKMSIIGGIRVGGSWTGVNPTGWGSQWAPQPTGIVTSGWALRGNTNIAPGIISAPSSTNSAAGQIVIRGRYDVPT